MRTNIDFETSSFIADPKRLFGRTPVLNELFIKLSKGSNLQLYGERRSGKTSVIKCLLEKHKDDDKRLYIYINSKECFQRGTVATYSFIILKIIERIDKEIANGILGVKGHESSHQFLDHLLNLDLFYVVNIFKKLVNRVASDLKKGIVLLIDEYEYLFTQSLSNTNDFFHIRTLTEEPKNDDGIKSLTYLISGSTKWNDLGSKIGSPELNNQGAGYIYVGPLDFKDFQVFWSYYTSTDLEIFQKCDYVYQLSGGLPFYAKLLGEQLLSNINGQIDYSVTFPHLKITFEALKQDEKDLVDKVFRSEYLSIKSSSTLQDLHNRGIIHYKDSIARCNGLLVEKYLQENPLNTLKGGSVLEELRSDIISITFQITENSKLLNKQEPIFELTAEDSYNFDGLSKACIDLDTLQNFTSKLYKLFIERTKAEIMAGNGSSKQKNLQTLPESFRKHSGLLLIDQARHYFGSHNTGIKAWKSILSKEEVLLRTLGENRFPFSPDDYQKIQMNLLRTTREFLKELNEYFITIPHKRVAIRSK